MAHIKNWARLTTVALATGGVRSCDAAKILHMADLTMYGVPGEVVVDDFTAGGPLDAPDVMPAGSVAADSYGWRGNAIVGPTEIRRQS